MTDRDVLKFLFVMLVALTVPTSTFAQESLLSEAEDERAAMREQVIPTVQDGHFSLPSLLPPSLSTENIGNGRTPDDFRGQEDSPLEPLPESGSQRGQVWNWSICNWAAANTFSNPRYFEDRMLERHGHKRCGHLQPLVSGARFFATVPMLPYLMTIREPCDCEYTLGYYRPGSAVPAMLQRPPYERHALIIESAAVAGAMIAFP
jgi:hypothetical protein